MKGKESIYLISRLIAVIKAKRYIGKWNTIENPEICPIDFLTKAESNGEEIAFSTDGVGTIRYIWVEISTSS